MRNIGISVVVPVYNTEKYLEECIESVISQNYDNYEIILVDDGSTDSSSVICDRYSQYNDVHVIHKKNGGQLSARIKGEEIANKEIVIFLDSDDRLVNGSLQIINNTFALTNADCVIFNLIPLGKNIKEDKESNKHITYSNKHDIMMNMFLNQDLNSVCRKAVKRVTTERLSLDAFYHIRMGEDLIHSIHIMEKCKNVVVINDSLYEYRCNPESVSQLIKRKGNVTDFLVEKYVLDYLTNDNLTFGEIDITKYLLYVNTLLYNRIIRIILLRLPKSQKIEILKLSWETEFYKNNLRRANLNPLKLKMRIILCLFSMKQFHALIFAGTIYLDYILRDKQLNNHKL